MKNLDLQNGKALIVVAHPDDETIWMGGTILRYPNISWTIFALCRANDSERCQKFLRVIKFYNARGIISDLEDEGVLTLKESLPEIKKRIKKELKERVFDYVFTHGPEGEYGHLKHKGIHCIVKRLVQEKELVTDNLFFFAYKKDKKGIGISSLKAGFYLKLSEKEFKIKRNIIKNLYGFSKFSFENRSCGKIETFVKFKQIK